MISVISDIAMLIAGIFICEAAHIPGYLRNANMDEAIDEV
jgi:hypothetical protein